MKAALIPSLSAAMAAALLGSPRALAQPRPPLVFAAPEPPREVITWQERVPNGNLVAGGVLTLGLTYGTSVVVGATSDRASDQYLFVPVAGPWMDLANRDCWNNPCGVDEAGNQVLLMASGIVQAAGVLEIAAGFLLPVTRTVTRVAAVPKGVHVTPTAGPSSVGLAAYGAF